MREIRRRLFLEPRSRPPLRRPPSCRRASRLRRAPFTWPIPGPLWLRPRPCRTSLPPNSLPLLFQVQLPTSTTAFAPSSWGSAPIQPRAGNGGGRMANCFHRLRPTSSIRSAPKALASRYSPRSYSHCESPNPNNIELKRRVESDAGFVLPVGFSGNQLFRAGFRDHRDKATIRIGAALEPWTTIMTADGHDTAFGVPRPCHRPASLPSHRPRTADNCPSGSHTISQTGRRSWSS